MAVNNSDIVAFIFARGGSKGLPGKNIRPFAGKPLIAWAIEQAKEVPRISRVLISTDSEEIATVAREYGAEVPFIRPATLATDQAPEWLAWRHAFDYLKNFEGRLPAVATVVPVTAPLRIVSDIDQCLDLFMAGNADVVVTVSDAHRNPHFNMVKSNYDGSVGLVCPLATGINRRQEAPQVFDMTTIAYVLSPAFALTHDSIFEGRVRAVSVPRERAIDIDTRLDFEVAEFLFQKQKP